MGHRHFTIAGVSAPVAAIDGAAALPAIAKVIESIDLDLGVLICCDRKTRGPVGIDHCYRSRLRRSLISWPSWPRVSDHDSDSDNRNRFPALGIPLRLAFGLAGGP
jgi:hypothetical protein